MQQAANQEIARRDEPTAVQAVAQSSNLGALCENVNIPCVEFYRSEHTPHNLRTPPRQTGRLVYKPSKRASRNAIGANPAHNFWTVLQADSARKATQRQRFPRSAESEPHNTCGKPPRSPEPRQNCGSFSAKPPRSRRGAPASKVAEAFNANADADATRNSAPTLPSTSPALWCPDAALARL